MEKAQVNKGPGKQVSPRQSVQEATPDSRAYSAEIYWRHFRLPEAGEALS